MGLDYNVDLYNDKDLLDQIYKLISLPFNKVRHNLDLLNLFNKVYNANLCRVCEKDREYAYIKLIKFYNDAEKKIQN